MIVVGFLGRLGSGKTTAAKYLEEAYGAKRYSFAEPLKDLSQLLWEFTDEQVRGTQEQKGAIDPRWGISPRTAMIRLGDGARHALWDGVWLETCFQRILLDAPNLAVIDDVRYPNEAAAIDLHTRFIGRVIKLDYTDRVPSSADDAPSERSVDEVSLRNIYWQITHRESPGAEHLTTALDRAMVGLSVAKVVV